MLKLKDNPPMLAPQASTVRELGGTWWVAHTKPRTEKALAFDFLVERVGYYLPMAKKVIMSGGRKRHLMMPLFPSYVFFCGDLETRMAAFQTGRLVQAIPVVDPAKLVNELAAIEKALAGDGRLDLYPFAVVGRRCRVRAGAFIGIEGTIASRNERDVLILQVSMLGCGVALDIAPSLLEPVE